MVRYGFLFLIPLLSGGLLFAGEPKILWEMTAEKLPVLQLSHGAEVLAGNVLRIHGPARPFAPIDASLLRGKTVTVECMVRGEKLGQTALDCLRLTPNYRPFDRFRENWGYRPPRPVPVEKTDWIRWHGTWHIPDYAGNFNLVFAHAGKTGWAEYKDVRILDVPLPKAARPEASGRTNCRTCFRGAVVGRLRNEEDFRVFAEKFGGNLMRWQFLHGGPASFKTPEEYLNWGRERIRELQTKLPYFRKYNIKFVIDLHRGAGEVNAINNNLNLWNKPQQEAMIQLWREIARTFKDEPLVYGYDLLNEPNDKNYDVRSGALDRERLYEAMAKAVREIDPKTPVIIQETYQLNAFDIPNVIYSPHTYEPGEYTHQGVIGSGRDIPVYPDPKKGWDRAFLKRMVQPLREFQLKYNAKIYVGEFGCVAWAKGADQWLKDWISIYEEYGWDWTYHAYREALLWSVEHAGTSRRQMHPAEDTARKRVILEALHKNKEKSE